MKNSALFRFAAASVAAASLFTALPATAAIGDSAACRESALTLSNPGYLGCQLFLPGVVTGDAGNIADLEFFFSGFTGNSTFVFAGRSNEPNAGPFQRDPGRGSVGTLQFDQPMTGLFVLALQSDLRNAQNQDNFSAYLFDSSAFGGLAPSINFDTFGVGDDNGRSGLLTPLRFAGLFIQPSAPGTIPEPAGAALVLTALGALALTKRRR